MIKGLYEAHLPVSDLERSIEFYEKLGLRLYKRYEKVAFFGSKKEKVGLVYGKVQNQKYLITFH
ncbi:catechol 2,3-dioxygenase-like lactoylglutathione lyase family enzyme [Neobacillus cucumis]|nr:catechol 2,3-dioxygenase-like lactoylglutathione lyase family enzyme [Neobacillus cucumis]